jgi:hypothetical protein
LLDAWGIPVRQVGADWARKGLQDEDIIVSLRALKRATFFTRDAGFYDKALGHGRYCLAILTTGQYEVAQFIRRFLRHSSFNTQAKRMGKVIRVAASGIVFWEIHHEPEISRSWIGD